MAKFRKVYTVFWDDPLMEKLNPDARYFYLFLITNPLCTECGIYQISFKKMCNYTGYNEDSIKALIKLFEIDYSRIVYDTSTDEICLLKKPNFIENTGKPVVDCLNSEFLNIKNKKLIIRQMKHIDKEPVRKVYDAWYGTYIATSKKLGQEKEEEEEEEKEELVAAEEKKEEEKKELVAEGEIGSEKVKQIANDVWKDQSWKEQICIGLSLTMEELKKWLAQFNSSVASDNIPGFNRNQYKKMSRGWIISQKAKGTSVETGRVTKKSDSAPLSRL